MKDHEKILLLFDGSETGEEVERYAAQFKSFENAQLVLFHVLSNAPASFWDMERIPQTQNAISQLVNWEKEQMELMKTFAGQVRQSFVNAGLPEEMVTIKIKKRQSGIARDILHEAEDGGYTAIAFKRLGAQALKGITIGSVANKILANASFCPLLIAGRRPMHRRLLMAIDGSPVSEKMVEFVIQQVSRASYTVGLFHVIRGLHAHVEKTALFMAKEYLETAQQTMDRVLDGLQKKLVHAGFAEVTKKIVTGVPSRAEAIVREAEEGEYDTIIVGRKGLSQVRQFFMGRVCHKVLYGADEFAVWVV